jgi:sugar phosphate isomerase/epimerase
MAIARESIWHPNRREILKCWPVICSTVFPARASNSGSVPPTLKFPTESRARLAVTSYPFRQFLVSPRNAHRNSKVSGTKMPGMDMTHFPSFVAETFGVFNINPLMNHFSSTQPAYLQSFRTALDKAHSHIVDLGLPGGRMYAADFVVRQSAAKAASEFIDIAVQVGSPSVRLHVEAGKADKRDIGLAAATLGAIAEHGANRNVVVNLENDNPVAEDPFFLVAVIEKVNNPYLRALPDFGNSLIGHDAEFNSKVVGAMLSHAFNMCHVKQTVQGNDGKRSTVDLANAFQLAKKSGFQGYFSMEFETELGDPIAGTKQLISETLHYLS